MHSRLGVSVVAALLLMTSACGSARGGPRPATQRDLITRSEIENNYFQTALDLVQSLRANWVRTRGPDSIMGRPSEVLVYVDGIRAGPVEYLRTVHPMVVESIRFYPGIEASSQWGLDHGGGVIYVSTRR